MIVPTIVNSFTALISVALLWNYTGENEGVIMLQVTLDEL